MTLAVNLAQGASNNVTFRNRIINGGMVINQRGWSGTITSDGTYTLDRWAARSSASSKFSVSQNAGSVTPPVGFVNYLGVTSLSAYSVSSTDYFAIEQVIEGYNIADMNFGGANAKTITLSFQVYSSLTGTFSGALLNDARDRVYPFTYTISSANTWTAISVTLAGDTSGTWLTTNGAGLYVRFCLGAGSTRLATAGSWQTTAGAIFGATGTTSVVGTSGATFYITGVQLEAGTTASPFEYRQYGTEFALCQRYYYSRTYSAGQHIGVSQAYTSNGTAGCWIHITNVFRTNPTLLVYPAPSAIDIWNSGAAAAVGTSAGTTPAAMGFGIYWDINRTGGGLSAGNATEMIANTTATFGLSAEL
jgi:hypothetical protein